MAALRMRSRALDDLVEIGAFTYHRWGPLQADRYVEQIEHMCEVLSDFPTIGRPCFGIKNGMYRMECGKHVIFYEREDAGVVVHRILHDQRLPDPTVFDDDES